MAASVSPIELDTPPELRQLKVEVDWRAYFRQFCQAHGNYPVQDSGVLLFPDGWTYSADDYAGPEWPPPTDPLRLAEIQRRYWFRRRQIVVPLRDQLDKTIQALDEQRRLRPLPLVTTYETEIKDDAGHVVGVDRWIGEMDWTAMAGRLKWLIEDARLCEQHVHELDILIQTFHEV